MDIYWYGYSSMYLLVNIVSNGCLGRVYAKVGYIKDGTLSNAYATSKNAAEHIFFLYYFRYNMRDSMNLPGI